MARQAYDPYKGRYLTPDEAWKAASNPLIYKHVVWTDDTEEKPAR